MPLNHSHKIQAPVLVFHGRNDTRAPVNETEQLVFDMKQRGQTVDFTIFADEGHQIEKMANQIRMNRKIVAFMKRHLQDG